MKKILFITLIATILGASCTSTKSGIFNKRKYTKGFFVDTKGRAPKVKERTSVAAIADPAEKPVLIRTERSVAKPAEDKSRMVTAAASHGPANAVAQVKPVSVIRHDNKSNWSHANSSSEPSAPTIVQAKKFSKVLKNERKKGSSGDTELILLVILSLFPILALIAIYLKDGKQITLNFWIDLILHFVVLYWLFALLRVLDVINLA